MSAEITSDTLLLTAAERDHAQRLAALWVTPAVPEPVAAEMAGTAYSTWMALKARGATPPTFAIGRRQFVLVADLRRWLDDLAAEAKAAK